MIGHDHITFNGSILVKVVQLTDVFISDLSVFWQFDLRTGEDAGPYNAREDTTSFFRAYREKHGLILIIVRTFQPSGLAIFQFVHFYHPSHYTTNRQRKQVLCRHFVHANSPLRTTDKELPVFGSVLLFYFFLRASIEPASDITATTANPVPA